MRFEPLHYDAENRVIYDENRLAVARDVAPDLGAVFAMAPAYRQTLDDIRQHAVNPGDRAHDVLSQEAEAVEGQPAGDAETPPLWAILKDILAYQAEQFDADSTFDVIRWEGERKSQRIMCGLSRTERDEHERTVEPEPNISYQYEEFLPDLQVSGSDLVDAFTEWRGQLRAALAATRSPRPAALDRIAARLRGEWYNPAGDLESDIADVLREAGAYD